MINSDPVITFPLGAFFVITSKAKAARIATSTAATVQPSNQNLKMVFIRSDWPAKKSSTWTSSGNAMTTEAAQRNKTVCIRKRCRVRCKYKIDATATRKNNPNIREYAARGVWSVLSAKRCGALGEGKNQTKITISAI